MPSTTAQISSDTYLFDRIVADLKQCIDFAKALQAEVAGKVVGTAKSVATFNQASFAASVRAGQILAAGSQDLFRQTVESNQSAFTEIFAGVSAAADTKTVKERIDLQTHLVRTSAIRAMSEGSRFAHASIDLTETASVPLKAHAVAAAKAVAALKA